MKTIRKWIGVSVGLAMVVLFAVGFVPDTSNFNNTQFLTTGTTVSIAHLSASLVDSGALNIAQMPSLAANTVLGIGAGGGTPVALTMGANMSIVAGALTAAGGGSSTNYWQTNSGYVFPVALLSGLGVSNNLGFFNAGGDISLHATNYATLTTNLSTGDGPLVRSNAPNINAANLLGASTIAAATISNAQFIPSITFTNPDSITWSKLGVGSSTNSLVLTNQFGDRQLAVSTNTSPIWNFQDGVTFDGSGSIAGGALTSVAGTRTFTHDSNHTLITNTTTRTASEWTAGSQYEWYNGTKTITIDKTNGIITTPNFVTPNASSAVGQVLTATNTSGGSGWRDPSKTLTFGGNAAAGGTFNFSSSSTKYYGPSVGLVAASSPLVAIGTPSGTLTNFYVTMYGIGTSTNATFTILTNDVATGITVSVIGNGNNPVVAVDTTHFAVIPDQCRVSVSILGNNPTAAAASVNGGWNFQLVK